jgi:hypothetical protein
MRFSGDQLGMRGFMHEMLYWIMHNGFWVMHYQICGFTGYLLVHLSVPEFFGAKIYPNMFCVWWIHPLSIVSRLANTFPCQLLKRRSRNLEMGTGPMHLACVEPQKMVTTLEPPPSASPTLFENSSCSMTGSVSCNISTPINPFRKKKLLNTSWTGLMEGPSLCCSSKFSPTNFSQLFFQ